MEEIKKIKVVTHSGTYHADDVFALACLTLAYEKEGMSLDIIRSRKEEDIATADIVVDVGGVYDPAQLRFDHHQKEGAGKRENGVPYASFGIVWKTFGEKLCSSVFVVKKIDEAIVQQVDGLDNGTEMFTPLFEGIHPLSFDTFFRVNANVWDEGKENFDEAFLESVNIAKKFLARLIRYNEAIQKAEEIVKEIYTQAEDKRLLVLDTYLPWGKAASALPEPLYVVYQRPEGTWATEAVRVEKESFKNRKNFPLPWAGLRDEEMAKVSGVTDAIFCHNGLFIAVAKSREGAIKLAKIALES